MKYLVVFFLLGMKLYTCGNKHKMKSIVKIDFYVDDTLQKIGNNLRVSFLGQKDTFKTYTNMNAQIEIPKLASEKYNVDFSFGNNLLIFKDVSADMLNDTEMRWAIGIDKRPFNNLLGLLSYEDFLSDSLTKELQFWQFFPKNGDGIQFVNKIK